MFNMWNIRMPNLLIIHEKIEFFQGFLATRWTCEELRSQKWNFFRWNYFNLPKFEVSFLVIVAVPSNGEPTPTYSARVRLIARVRPHVCDDGRSLKSIESAAFALIASRAVEFGSCVQVDWFHVKLQALTACIGAWALGVRTFEFPAPKARGGGDKVQLQNFLILVFFWTLAVLINTVAEVVVRLLIV